MKIAKPIHFVFIEENKNRIEHLASLIKQLFPDIPKLIEIHYFNGSCEDKWEDALSEVWGQPIFANLDPFGVGIPNKLITKLASNKGSELMVTFMSEWFNRFAILDNIDTGDQQFGTTEWRKVKDISTDGKESFLVNQYTNTIKRAGFKFTLPFRLTNERGKSFFLIYATCHEKGLEKMKESMWKTDPVNGTQFRDPRDPNQGILDFGKPAPNLTPLIRLLTDYIKETDHKAVTLDELKQFTLFETAFRPPHTKQAVKQMLEERQLQRNPESGNLSGITEVFF